MHRCTVACFAHEHQQGHGCLCDTNASRAAMGLGPICFPIEEEDIPLTTPESAAEPVPGIAQAIVGFIVLVVLGVSAVALQAFVGG